LYAAGNLATEVEDAVKTLSDIIRDVQVTDGFREVLNEEQLDDVYCAALKLSIAVVKYFAKVIDYFESGTYIFAWSLMISSNSEKALYEPRFYP
jgi:hypothetical protein